MLTVKSRNSQPSGAWSISNGERTGQDSSLNAWENCLKPRAKESWEVFTSTSWELEISRWWVKSRPPS